MDKIETFLKHSGVDVKKYSKLLDIMDEFRSNIKKDIEVNQADFERKVYKLFPEKDYDWQFCEYIAQALKEENRYTEVFDALYGTIKYKGLDTDIEND